MQGQSLESGAQAVAVASPPPAQRVEFVEKLEVTRHDMHRFLLARAGERVALLFLALAGVLVFADWLLVLGSGIRATGLAILAVLTLVFLYRWAVAPRRFFRKEDAAAEVETTFPDLGQQVRTALEYVEPTPATAPALPGMVNALTNQTDQRTRKLDLTTVIPWRSLRWLGAGVIAVVIVYGWLLATKPELRIAAGRLFLLPVHYTDLKVEPGDQTLKAGEGLAVQATLTGRPVKKVALQIRSSGQANDWNTLPFATDDDHNRQISGTLETIVADCRESLEYRVLADSLVSPVYHVKVIHPLNLQKLEATIEPPAYTRRKPVTVKEGNFQVIEGSKVDFRIALDRAPQSARLQLVPTGKGGQGSAPSEVPLEIRDNALHGQVAAIDKETDYEIQAEAADGMRLDAGKFHIKILPDRKPTVHFVKPKEQIEVTPTTEVHMKVEAGDDFGVSKMGVVYQIGDGPPQTLYLKEHPDQPTSLKTEAILSLEDHKLDFKDGVTYYAFVEDNHPIHPQRTTTDLQFIDIRPFKRSFQLVEGGGC
ncbi:MAG TPA: DUF4175 family protein [Gemmataceae bacterium]|nr:DUF4175 family protein [Gemmataceae bacterium]